MIVKFYCQTSWPQPLGRVINQKKIGFTVCQRCIKRKTQVEVKKKAYIWTTKLNFARKLNLGKISQNLFFFRCSDITECVYCASRDGFTHRPNRPWPCI